MQIHFYFELFCCEFLPICQTCEYHFIEGNNLDEHIAFILSVLITRTWFVKIMHKIIDASYPMASLHLLTIAKNVVPI